MNVNIMRCILVVDDQNWVRISAGAVLNKAGLLGY